MQYSMDTTISTTTNYTSITANTAIATLNAIANDDAIITITTIYDYSISALACPRPSPHSSPRCPSTFRLSP
jgi:hypothetical protein